MTAQVVGIDLSLTSTGVAAVNTLSGDVWVERVQSKGLGDTLTLRARRLTTITSDVLSHLRNMGLSSRTLVVIEGPSFGQARQGGQHDRAGLWWMVVQALLDLTCLVVEVPPACRAKYATGKGNAAKDAVLAAAIRRYPQADITGNDIADAVVLAAMGAHGLQCPIAEVPQVNATALAKVAWPALNLEGITP